MEVENDIPAHTAKRHYFLLRSPPPPPPRTFITPPRPSIECIILSTSAAWVRQWYGLLG